VDSLLFTVGAFGVEVAAARLAVAAVLAVAVGMMTMPSTTIATTAATAGNTNGNTTVGDSSPSCCDADAGAGAGDDADCCSSVEDTSTSASAGGAAASPQPAFVLRVFSALCSLFLEVAPWVGTGILFSAGCNVLAPAGGLWHAGGGDSLLKRVILLGATVPVQLCEHGVVTVAAALAKQGVSAGTAFAFIVVGPATNTSLLMLIASLAGQQTQHKGGQQQQQHRGDSGNRSIFSNITLVPKVVAVIVTFGLCLSYAVDAIAPFVPALLALGADGGGGSGSGGGGGGFLPDWYVEHASIAVAVLAASAVVRSMAAGGKGVGKAQEKKNQQYHPRSIQTEDRKVAWV